MKIHAPHKRLTSLWGIIDTQHNAIIASHIKGKRVLDVGCGYGSLTAYLANKFQVVGIEPEPDSYDIARKIHPQCDIRPVSLQQLDQEPNFDTIVLRDCLHHLVNECNINTVFTSIHRLLVPKGQLVIWDPNPHLLLRFCRMLIRHQDPEVPLRMAKTLLQKHDFIIDFIHSFEIIGLPLSGGYVGPQLLPNYACTRRWLASANLFLSRLVEHLHLGSMLAFRYCIVAHARGYDA